nr:AraC family transcriptional regulator [uncultured Dongia sp.]
MLRANNAARVVRADDKALDVFGNHCFLPQGELWFSRSSQNVTVSYPDDDILRVRLWHSGAGALCRGSTSHRVDSNQASVSTAAAEVDFDAGFGQICWRIHKAKIEQKLAIVTGRPLGSALHIETALDLAAPQAGTLVQIMSCMLQLADKTEAMPLPIALAELEQAFMVGLLSLVSVDGRSLMDVPAASVAPWQVRRAEHHIEANWDKPITIEDLAAVTGTSSRSLFRTFKASRGCSPLDYARRLRLDHARRMLENPQPSTSVTDVACACGFGDLGRFSKDFLRSFGERPSDVLARKRGIVAAA